MTRTPEVNPITGEPLRTPRELHEDYMIPFSFVAHPSCLRNTSMFLAVRRDGEMELLCGDERPSDYAPTAHDALCKVGFRSCKIGSEYCHEFGEPPAVADIIQTARHAAMDVCATWSEEWCSRCASHWRKGDVCNDCWKPWKPWKPKPKAPGNCPTCHLANVLPVAGGTIDPDTGYVGEPYMRCPACGNVFPVEDFPNA